MLILEIQHHKDNFVQYVRANVIKNKTNKQKEQKKTKTSYIFIKVYFIEA